MHCPFDGSIAALPTPFNGRRLDLGSLNELIESHVEAKTSAVLVTGTTGEASTLTEYEKRHVIHAAVDFANGRIPVIAGVGTNDTATTVELARFAAACGIDALLVVVPYYNRPSKNGLRAHFGAVADSIGIPVILYNVPSRTGTDLEPELVRELCSRHENIVAIKEVTTDRSRMSDLIAIDGLQVFCGEDTAISDFASLGADGAISVTSNILPDEIAELIETARPGGNVTRACEIVEEIAPFVNALFVEPNPVPVKHALAALGRMRVDVRLPLAPLEEASARTVESALERFRVAAAVS